jgi:hypothetical protein
VHNNKKYFFRGKVEGETMREFKLLRKNGGFSTYENLRLFGEIVEDQNGNSRKLKKKFCLI